MTGSRRAGSGRLKRILAAPLIASPLCPDTKKENVRRRSLFLCGQAGTMASHERRLRCGCRDLPLLFGIRAALSSAVRQRRGPAIPTRKKFFQGGGEHERGEGQFLQKTSLPPLVQKSVAANYSSSPAVSPSS